MTIDEYKAVRDQASRDAGKVLFYLFIVLPVVLVLFFYIIL